ncbi:MAG: monomethylamine:corrinoid methyltransferase [Spirochaetales bacterium]|nr:monomethylamine:corrinoid methyltransferase [Spirochaetales bacterium]
MIGFWDVYKRSESGPFIKEQEFDKQLGTVANRLVQKHGIRFDREQVIPSDDGLADKVYEAALELFLELGIYCRDSSRLIRFSPEEVQWALKHAPITVTYGQGPDTRVMRHRKVEDTLPPFCLNTPVGCTVAEERFVAMVQSYAQEPLSDTFSSAFSQTVGGRPIKSGTPQEVEAAIWNVVKLREAARAAGRPLIGIHNLISNAEKTDATLAAIQEEFGAHPNDGLAVAAIAEMKADYERMKKVVFLDHKGYNRYGLYGPIMGGYAGGPEATAIVHVAHHFLGLLAFGAQWHDGFPLHLMQGCNSTRDLLWLISVTGQALARNTHLLIGVSPFTAAGPCTEMVVQEIAAVVLAATVSGLHLNLVAVARNKLPERSSGMEARIGAETAHLIAGQGVSRTKANEIVMKILGEYESRIPEAPQGKRFDECYDLKTVRPTQEYLDVYDRVKEQLTKFGLEYGD